MSVQLGQIRLVSRPYLGNAPGAADYFPEGAPKPVEYTCPLDPPANIMAPGIPIANDGRVYAATIDPTLNCMKDARGNTICSDGSHYPPGCPHTPPDMYFTPGITPDVTTGSRIEGQVPQPRVAGSVGGTSTGGALVTPIAIGAATAAALIGAFFYFK